MKCLNASTAYRQPSDLPLDLTICWLVTHKIWGKEGSIVGVLGNLLREVLILKMYQISFSRATNQWNCASAIRIEGKQGISCSYTIIRYTKCNNLLIVMFLSLCPKHLNIFSDKPLMKIAVTSLRLRGIQLFHPSCIKQFVCLFCYSYRVKEKLFVSLCLTVSIWDVATSEAKYSILKASNSRTDQEMQNVLATQNFRDI